MTETGRHLTAEDAGRWVAGVLEPEAVGDLEVHLRACPACAELLRREARAELALRAAVAEAGRPVARRRRRLGWALAAAAAAALLLGLLWSPRSLSPAPVEVPRFEGAVALPVAEGPAPL